MKILFLCLLLLVVNAFTEYEHMLLQNAIRYPKSVAHFADESEWAHVPMSFYDGDKDSLKDIEYGILHHLDDENQKLAVSYLIEEMIHIFETHALYKFDAIAFQYGETPILLAFNCGDEERKQFFLQYPGLKGLKMRDGRSIVVNVEAAVVTMVERNSAIMKVRDADKILSDIETVESRYGGIFMILTAFLFVGIIVTYGGRG